MQATRLMRIPFFATGVKVTEDNMSEIARWCGGEVVTETNSTFVRVPVFRATHRRQTEGLIGTWVIRTIQRGEPSYKVYDEPWLFNQFTVMSTEMMDGLDTVGKLVEIGVYEKDEPLIAEHHCCCNHNRLPGAHPVPVQNTMPSPANIRRAS